MSKWFWFLFYLKKRASQKKTWMQTKYLLPILIFHLTNILNLICYLFKIYTYFLIWNIPPQKVPPKIPFWHGWLLASVFVSVRKKNWNLYKLVVKGNRRIHFWKESNKDSEESLPRSSFLFLHAAWTRIFTTLQIFANAGFFFNLPISVSVVEVSSGPTISNNEIEEQEMTLNVNLWIQLFKLTCDETFVRIAANGKRYLYRFHYQFI